MKYYIIAGEASGDLHASNLIKELKQLDPQADFRGWGGDLMGKQGMKLVMHYRDVAFMGFIEVLRHLRTILKNIKSCQQDILSYQPDALILVDYPGFNLRIAEFAKKNGFKVLYYISPQLWAWKQSRVKHIKKYVDRMFVILPFEQSFYFDLQYNTDFVGHPLLDVITDIKSTDDRLKKQYDLDDKPIIALLPGSRKQEIEKVLPVMISIIPSFKRNYQFVIGGLNTHPESFYKDIIGDASVKIIYNETYELLRHAHAALVTSGTASLETALFEVPEVVCYKGSQLSYMIAKQVVTKNLRFISLVNLIMNDVVITELIQNELTTGNLKFELDRLLNNEARRESIIQSYKELKEKLGGEGASRKTAELIIHEIRNTDVRH